jgi:hypothetical protein
MASIVGLRMIVIPILLLGFATSPQAQSLKWQRYVNPTYRYQIELPIGMFEVREQTRAKLSLYEVDGLGQLDVYGADNAERLTPQEFAGVVEQADRVEEVTYRAGGRSWFVLSGYYRREAGEVEDLIFYAKFMFSPDRSRLAAFEISYPLSQKRRFDAIVDRLESSLRAPDGY